MSTGNLLREARRYLDKGDLREAARLVARRLLDHPDESAALTLVDELLDRAEGDPDRVVPVTDGVELADLLLRVQLHSRRGQTDDGLELLVQLLAVHRDERLVERLEHLISAASVRGIDAHRFVDASLRAVARLDALSAEDARARSLLAQLGTVLEGAGLPGLAPLASFASYRSSGSVHKLRGLESYVDDHPQDGPARYLLGQVTPFVAFIPEPGEAIVAMARELTSKQTSESASGAQVSIRLSHLEAPSAVFAAQMALVQLPGVSSLDLEVESIPEPDPREPARPVTWQVWEFDGIAPHPVVAKPPVGVLASVRRIVATPFHIDRWCDLAREEGARRLVGASADALLGALVHTPPRPDSVMPWDWLRACQLAATLLIAFAAELSWPGESDSLAMLRDLLDGPTDWSGAAAAIALAEVARRDPSVAPSVADALVACGSRRPTEGYWCLRVPLIHALLRLPGLPARERDLLRAERDA